MDLVRKFAIAVVMIVPGFVFGGLVWSLLHSWWAVLVAEAAVIAVYIMIISGKLSGTNTKIVSDPA
ncbi:hypothetical protein PITCH_A510002 [uncultured Desulfobacterium sp.]|uniref:Uncharacterized protein n=1 Tax=uncultured Desulfobacterium sp. TaxID=201089 RepID=A0A445N0M0_9BACT|nr:hypothetical protein PITCH_A510002 [uncultured Desulfobacterium sp.]